MERELKIVLSLGCTWFFFGFYSWFSTGDFVVPYIFTPFAILSASVFFLVLNCRKVRISGLLIFICGYLAFMLQDETTLGVLAHYFGSKSILLWSENDFLVAVAFVIFHLSVLTTAFFIAVETGNYFWLALLIPILILSVVFMFGDLLLFQELTFYAFCLTYFVVCHKISLKDHSVALIVSDQYLLIVVLESFEFLQ